MKLSFEEKVITAYSDGSPVEVIAESFMMTAQEVLDTLLAYKNKNRFRRSFSEDFKRMIAERDMSGVVRSDIAKELDINISTVKKSCEQFGQSLKERASSENMYTKIGDYIDEEKCISCGSKDYNQVDLDAYYCKKCGSEHTVRQDGVYQVNWEYLD